jgi:hypothetical protein
LLLFFKKEALALLQPKRMHVHVRANAATRGRLPSNDRSLYEEHSMARLAFAAALAGAALFSLPAMAAPGCSISLPRGIFSPRGAAVTMDVDNNGRPCVDRLWVRRGVIPFTLMEATKAPRHGELIFDQPSSFAYQPDDGFDGRDSFDVVARGNDTAGAPVTGTVHVNVRVRTLPRGEAWDPKAGLSQP